MSELTIREIQERKKNTELQITDLVVEFLEDTGMDLASIDIEKQYAASAAGRRDIVLWLEMRLEFR